MGHDVLCENCNKPYKEKDLAFKKSFYKKIGKEGWCDDCVNEFDVEFDE